MPNKDAFNERGNFGSLCVVQLWRQRELKRIVFLQYANAAAYPPILHASQILAAEGWNVRVRNVRSRDTALISFPESGRVDLQESFQPEPGWRQKLHYIRYACGALADVLRSRPHCVYGSDYTVAPIVWIISLFTNAVIIYHEHDTPESSRPTAFTTICLRARRAVALKAAAVVVPNRTRAEIMEANLGIPMPLVVWNCPSREEIVDGSPVSHDGFRLLYHGSINESRVPKTLLQSLALSPATVTITIIGYETIHSRGYISDLLAEADRLGISSRVTVLPAVSSHELARVRVMHDVGVAIVCASTNDANLQHLSGASCKVFEYMAAGVVPLVPATADWNADFVDPGFAIACDPDDAASISTAIGKLIADPALRRRMGEQGPRRVAADWNYEAQFAPVVATLSRLLPGSRNS